MAPKRRLLRATPGEAGVDEVGRGPLAGPVVVAAVILPRGFSRAGLRDSKKLTAEQREEQSRRIRASCEHVIVVVETEEVDKLNILQASLVGMERAVAALTLPPTKVWVDGNKTPPGLVGVAEAVIGGDDKIACIAAASIVAKVHRDRLMVEYDAAYPGYGFAGHKGYAAPDHLRALRELGPCPIHRRSFRPVQEAEQPCLIFAE